MNNTESAHELELLALQTEGVMRIRHDTKMRRKRGSHNMNDTMASVSEFQLLELQTDSGMRRHDTKMRCKRWWQRDAID